MPALNTAALLNPQGSDPNAAKTATPTIRISGEGGGNGLYQAQVDGLDMGQWHANLYSQVDVTTPPISDGPHIFTFQELVPNPGNATTPYNFTVDTQPPAAPIIQAASAIGPDTNGKYQIQASGTAEGRSLQLFSGLRLLGGSIITSGHWNVATVQQSPGQYSLTAKAIDWAGNVSAPSIAWPLTVGTVTPPSGTVPAAVAQPSITSTVVTRSELITWSAPADNGSPITSYNVYRNGSLLVSTPNRTWTDTIPGTGTYTYTVSAVNAVGEGPQSPARTV